MTINWKNGQFDLSRPCFFVYTMDPYQIMGKVLDIAASAGCFQPKIMIK